MNIAPSFTDWITLKYGTINGSKPHFLILGFKCTLGIDKFIELYRNTQDKGSLSQHFFLQASF
jgi:hypothetical protein